MSISHRDVNTYSSDGRIIQVEYAMKAVELGTTSIGVRLADCVILLSEKKLTSPLQNPRSIRKHFRVFDRIAFAISGVSSDAPGIVDRCRSLALQHYNNYSEQIPTAALVNELCAQALQFGEEEADRRIYSRPFGVALLLAAYEDGPLLYALDPSGSAVAYRAHAIGAAQEAVLAQLESQYNASAGRDDAIRWLLGILRGAVKDAVTGGSVDITVVDAAGARQLEPHEIEAYLQ